MLLAFQLEELRDYFVEGHAGNGVQKEPDHAESAGAFRNIPITQETLPRDLEESIGLYIEARRALKAALDLIDGEFNAPFMALLEAGKHEDAVAVLNAMPDTYLRTVAIERLLQSGMADTSREAIFAISAAPYSREQASALVQWQRARIDERRIGDIHGDFALRRAEDILKSEGEEALTEFAEILPPSMARAHIASMVRTGGEARKTNAARPAPKP